MPKTAIKIGPQDHGRHMSLEDFDLAKVQEGYLYELGRGVIVVSDVPGKCHLVQLITTRDQLDTYRAAHRGRIYAILGGAECKALIPDFESERHPDLSIYRHPMPDDELDWTIWVPDIAIEIVSLGSEQRDYNEKPNEYLRFGVREYWIIDADKEKMLVFRRSGDRWVRRTIRPGEIYRTRLLPGFAFDCGAVFAAARKVGE